MTVPRYDVPEPLRLQVLDFYERMCPLCGSEVPPSHVAHLFDDSEVPPTFEKLIVLCPTANLSYEHSKYPKTPGLHPTLEPTSVKTTADIHWQQGDFKKAYASNRLAAWLFESRKLDADCAAECLVNCISNLRPLRQGILLRHVVLHIEKLSTEQTVSLFWKFLFLNRLALVMFDYGRLEVGLFVISQAQGKMQELVKQEVMYPARARVAELNSLRVPVLLKCLTPGGLERGESALKFLDALRERDTELQRLDLDGYTTNLDVEAVVQMDVLKANSAAEQTLDAALASEQKVKHWWVIAELHVKRYRLLKDVDSEKAKDELEEAVRRIYQHGINIEPIKIGASCQLFDLKKECDHLGINPGLVVPHGATWRPPEHWPLELTDDEVKRIVANVWPYRS